MKESSSDISRNKATKATRLMRIEDTRKSGTEPKGMKIGIKTTPTADMATTANQNTKEIVTTETSKTTSTVVLTTKTTNTPTTLTNKEGNTADNSREDMVASNNKTTDTMIEEEMNSIRITSSLLSLDMMMKKDSPRLTSWARETLTNFQNQGMVTIKNNRLQRVHQRPIPSCPNGRIPPNNKSPVIPSPQSPEKPNLLHMSLSPR